MTPPRMRLSCPLRSQLRAKLCDMLTDGGIEPSLISRIATDDELVRQPFFWSEPGMKLFGRHPDVNEPARRNELLLAALEQQPIILAAFLEEAITSADKDASDAARLPELVGA